MDRLFGGPFSFRRLEGVLFRSLCSMAIVLVLGNVVQVRRFEYASLDPIVDAQIVGTSQAAASDLYLAPEIVTEYAIVRQHYEIRLKVDRMVAFPHASVEVTGLPGGSSVRPRMTSLGQGQETDGSGPAGCGEVIGQQAVSPNGEQGTSNNFTVLWNGCSATDNPTAVFDVLMPSGVVVQERLPLRFNSGGFFLQRHWFGGGVLRWGAPLWVNSQKPEGGGFGALAVLRLFFGARY